MSEGNLNVCCHHCRISRYRKRKNPVLYLGCSTCNNSFCRTCVEFCLGLNFELAAASSWSCLCCRNECCCNFQLCTKDHRHCFTYRRTKKRHEQLAIKRGGIYDVRSRKRRRRVNNDDEGEGDGEDDPLSEGLQPSSAAQPESISEQVIPQRPQPPLEAPIRISRPVVREEYVEERSMRRSKRTPRFEAYISNTFFSARTESLLSPESTITLAEWDDDYDPQLFIRATIENPPKPMGPKQSPFHRLVWPTPPISNRATHNIYQ